MISEWAGISEAWVWACLGLDPPEKSDGWVDRCPPMPKEHRIPAPSISKRPRIVVSKEHVLALRVAFIRGKRTGQLAKEYPYNESIIARVVRAKEYLEPEYFPPGITAEMLKNHTIRRDRILSDDEVRAIRKRYRAGADFASIVRTYPHARGVAHAICRGLIYKDVED